jgi:hypothetical protein
LEAALILLTIAIGLLNVCLGFGLAMYYGLGPPGLDGIWESLGPMPPAVPSPGLLNSDSAIGHDGERVGSIHAQSEVGVANSADGAATSVAQALAEEELVLDELRDLSAAARTAAQGKKS